MVDPDVRYDRTLLLGPKRDDVLDLAEVQRYGIDSFGDADYVSLYGHAPAELYALGVRVLGRTAVECTRDVLAEAIARDVAPLVGRVPDRPIVIVDPFAGSANTLYWLSVHLPGAHAVGFEADQQVFELTRTAIDRLGLAVELFHASFPSALERVELRDEDLLVAFVAPPWRNALRPDSGLDLRETEPPVADVVTELLRRHRGAAVCAVQTFERVVPDSGRTLVELFDWSTTRTYDFDEPGHNHGVVLGVRG